MLYLYFSVTHQLFLLLLLGSVSQCQIDFVTVRL